MMKKKKKKPKNKKPQPIMIFHPIQTHINKKQSLNFIFSNYFPYPLLQTCFNLPLIFLQLDFLENSINYLKNFL